MYSRKQNVEYRGGTLVVQYGLNWLKGKDHNKDL